MFQKRPTWYDKMNRTGGMNMKKHIELVNYTCYGMGINTNT